ncbi:insulinase family protein [Saprospiraceae bacterium]|nr:insulinase family protein [Saprospiraceae bacterium]
MQESKLRKFGPPIHNIRQIPLPAFQVITLDNGIPLYFINKGSQELAKLDVVFEGGRISETNKTQSRVFGSLLKEGTSNQNSEELSAYFDYHGAAYSTKTSLDFTTITLFSLSKHFAKLMPTFSSVIFDPIFPQKEFDKFIKNSIQRLQNDRSKNDIVAYRNLTAHIFGAESNYGYNSSEETYNNLSRDSILSYYNDFLSQQPCYLFLSGSYDDSLIESINQEFGQWKYGGNEWSPTYKKHKATLGQYKYSSKNTLQSAFRIGREFGDRRHEDFTKLSFLSNVFGGFFGSRLMKNIREEKGYTYNIYSDIDTLLYDGYFYIATELAGEHVDKTRSEIYKEMDILKNELISLEELEMNKNYILGNLLNSVDGPFQAIRLIKSSVLNKQTESDLSKMINTFINITPEEIQETARKYFDQNSFCEVIVG